MQTRDGITYMTVPETEIDIERFTHVHSEGNLVFGKYRGVNTVVDRRKQVFCHFATCRTFSCYGNDDYVYRRWGCVEKEEQYEFYDYRINGQVSKKHTFTKGTCFKVLRLGFYIQIYAQFPTYGYLGSEMCNTIETSDRHQQVPLPTGYKPINDSEINIDKFKLTTIVNDMVFGIYNNEHVCIDRHYAVFCSFVDVTLDNAPSAFTPGKWYKVNNTGDFVVTADQPHWLFNKTNGSFELVKGSVVKFEKKEAGTGLIMKIQVQNRGINYFGTELFNKIEPVKEEPVAKEQTNSPSFTLSDMLTQSNIGDVLGVYGPNETTVFVKAINPNIDASYICDANGNKWVLSNRNLKPINRNESNIEPKESGLAKEQAQEAVIHFREANGVDLAEYAIYSFNGKYFVSCEIINPQDLGFESSKVVTNNESAQPVEEMEIVTPRDIDEVMALVKQTEKKVNLGHLSFLFTLDFDSTFKQKFMHLPDREQNTVICEPVKGKVATISLRSGDIFTIFKSKTTGKLYKEHSVNTAQQLLDVKHYSNKDMQPTNQTQMSTGVLSTKHIPQSAPTEIQLGARHVNESKPTSATQFGVIEDIDASYPDHLFERAVKVDKTYSSSKGSLVVPGMELLNSFPITDETFKEYNESLNAFQISFSDKLLTYVPYANRLVGEFVSKLSKYNINPADMVNFDAGDNPWLIIQTPKVVKPIEKEPVVISHVLNTVDDLCNNTIPAKFCLITDTKQVYQMLSELEYKQYRQSQFAKGNPVVESIIDKTDQIWVKISM